MAFPNDLSDVSVFKIHPALGCARLANNDDYYEFFEFENKREANLPREYMSLRDGKHWMKRQAVRFRIFAYGADGTELGELTQNVMAVHGIVATWSANVANRKLNTWSQGATPVVEAQASASGAQSARLEGNNPWRPTKVWLGDITGDGLFIPPKGGVYRKTANSVIPPYGAHQRDNGVLDTTSDGAISVALTGIGAIPVIPAGIIVAPQDHSPDVTPGDIDNSTNMDFVRETRELLGIPAGGELNGAGYTMDLVAMGSLNAEYSPGMEICLEPNPGLIAPQRAFFARGQQHIHQNEIRPNYDPGHVAPGALSAGLCSAWQTDLNACLNYWTSTYPNQVEFNDAPNSRFLSRKDFMSNKPQETDPEWLNKHIDMMEVARNLDNDPNFLYGTERGADDNAGARPVAPFTLEPD